MNGNRLRPILVDEGQEACVASATTPTDPTMSHGSLDAVIADYMLAVEGGEVPNRQELLDHHPEHSEALRAFFADLDRMDQVASPLRIADGLGATGAADANGHTAMTKSQLRSRSSSADSSRGLAI